MQKSTFKNNLLAICAGFLLVLGLNACSSPSGPTMDCSDADAYAASIEKMKESMTDVEKAEFDASMFVITMSGMAKMANSGQDPSGNPEEMAMELMEDYCGLTAEQIKKKISEM